MAFWLQAVDLLGRRLAGTSVSTSGKDNVIGHVLGKVRFFEWCSLHSWAFFHLFACFKYIFEYVSLYVRSRFLILSLRTCLSLCAEVAQGSPLRHPHDMFQMSFEHKITTGFNHSACFHENPSFRAWKDCAGSIRQPLPRFRKHCPFRNFLQTWLYLALLSSRRSNGFQMGLN